MIYQKKGEYLKKLGRITIWVVLVIIIMVACTTVFGFNIDTVKAEGTSMDGFTLVINQSEYYRFEMDNSIQDAKHLDSVYQSTVCVPPPICFDPKGCSDVCTNTTKLSYSHIELLNRSGWIEENIKYTSRWETTKYGPTYFFKAEWPLFNWDVENYSEIIKNATFCFGDDRPGNYVYACHDYEKDCNSKWEPLGYLNGSDACISGVTEFSAFITATDGSSLLSNNSDERNTSSSGTNVQVNFTVHYLTPENISIQNATLINFTLGNGTSVNMSLGREELRNETNPFFLMHFNSHVNDSASGINCTNNGGTFESNAIINESIGFDGTNDNIKCGDLSQIDDATTLSGCAWVYHDTVGSDQAIISKADSSDNGIQLFRDDVGTRNNQYHVVVRDGADKVEIEGEATSSKPDRWTHVCFTFEALSSVGLRLYVDGDEDDNSPEDASSVNLVDDVAEQLTIGTNAWNNAKDFVGQIDEMIMWDRVLQPSEIQDIYLKGALHYQTNFTFPTEVNQSIDIRVEHPIHDNINATDSILVNNHPSINLNAPINHTNYSFIDANISVILNVTSADGELGHTTYIWVTNNETTAPLGSNSTLVFINQTGTTERNTLYNLTAHPYPADPDMLLWLHLDNRSEYGENDTLAYDFSGTYSEPKIRNTANLKNYGKFGRSLNMDGNSDFINLGTGNELDSSSTGTVAAWFKLDESSPTDRRTILSYADISSNNWWGYFYLESTTGALESNFRKSGTGDDCIYESSVGNITDMEWHHMTATNDGDTMTLYIDGENASAVLKGTSECASPYWFDDIAGSAERTCVGTRCPQALDDYWYGDIDELAVWNRALTPEEVKDLYRLKNGTYFWKVNVTDGHEANNTETRRFNINPAPEVLENETYQIALLNSTPFNASQSGDFVFSVNLSCTGIADCGQVNVTLDPLITTDPSKPEGSVSESFECFGNTGRITKSGAEKHLSVDIECLNATAFNINLDFENFNQYRLESSIGGGNYHNTPVRKTAGEDKFSISSNNLDLYTEKTITVVLDDWDGEWEMEIGEGTILVESSALSVATQWSSAESIVRDGYGQYIMVFVDGGSDISLTRDNGTNGTQWVPTIELDSGSHRSGNILPLSNLTHQVIAEDGTLELFYSSDNFSTVSGPTNIGQIPGRITEEAACEIATNNCYKCAFGVTVDWLYYTNCTQTSSTYHIVNDDNSDDTDYFDLILDNEDNEYIFGSGNNHGGIDFWSPKYQGWGTGNRTKVWATPNNAAEHIAAAFDKTNEKIYVCFKNGSSSIILNASLDNAKNAKFNATKLDFESSQCDISTNNDGVLTAIFGYNATGVRVVNSSDYLNTYTTMGPIDTGGGTYPHISHSHSNLTDYNGTLGYITTDSAGSDVYFGFFNVSYTHTVVSDKNGDIPEDSGFPFFINTSKGTNNPTSCTLNAGEYCIVNWTVTVNDTTPVGNIYEFFAYANSTNAGNKTLNVNVTIVGAPPPVDNSPTVTLESPIDNFRNVSDPAWVPFNCSWTDDNDLSSITLYHNNSGTWQANETQATSGTSGSNLFTIELSNWGYTSWNCLGTDNASQTTFATSNRTIILGLCGEVTYDHTLKRSITTGETCFNITSDNVALDLAGYNITSDGIDPDFGVYLKGYDNVKVSNGRISNFGSIIGGSSLCTANAINLNITNMELDNSVNPLFLQDSVSDGNFTNINITTVTGAGIYLNNSVTNYFNNIKIYDGGVADGILLSSSSDGNVFDHIEINNTDFGISFGLGSDNIFRNSNLTNIITTDIVLAANSLNNTFLNVTYASESVSTPGQLIRQWYYSANVTETDFTPINGATVLIYNGSGQLQNNLTTTATGLTTQIELTEYENVDGTTTYWNNYLVNASISGYNHTSKTHNITTQQNILRDLFILSGIDNPPTTGLNFPADAYLNVSSPNNITFNCTFNDDSGLDTGAIYITNPNNDTFAENFTTSLTGTSDTLQTTIELSYGEYEWNCWVNDTSNQQAFNDSNRSIVLGGCGDITTPEINIWIHRDLNTTDDCWDINADGVTLDIQGHNITGDGGVADNAVEIVSFNNIVVKNGKLSTFNYGINLVNSINNNITDMTITNMVDSGVYAAPTNNSIFNRINVSNSGDGFFLNTDSNSNTINNSRTMNISNFGIAVNSNSDFNIITNNIINATVDTGIRVSQTSTYNNISYNTIDDCATDTGFACFDTGSGAHNNVLIHNILKNSNDRGISLSSNNTLIRDTTLTNIAGTDVLIGNDDGNNTFLNVTFMGESVSSGGELIRQWYYSANVTNTSGLPVSNANVSIFANSTLTDLFGNLTTDTLGLTAQTEIIEYINLGGTTKYWNNYIINVTAPNHNYTTKTHNITSLSQPRNLIYDLFVLEASEIIDNPPNVSLIAPIPSYYNDTSDPFSLNISCNATDGEQVDNITLYITDSQNSTFAANQTEIVNAPFGIANFTVDLNNGNYTWNCLGIDNSSQQAFSSENRTILINFTQPNQAPTNPLIHYPTNQSNITELPYVNVSATDPESNPITFQYYFNNSLNATSSDNLTGINISDGFYELSVTANDGQNSSQNTTITFLLDGTNPTTTLNFPQDTYHNDTSDPVGVLFNCSATDNLIGVANISIYLTDSQNSSASWAQNQTIVSDSIQSNISLNNGNYTWNCLSYDNLGNLDWGVNRTMLINFSTPNLPPQDLVIFFPVNFTNYTSIGGLNFSANDPEDDPITYDIYVNGSLNITTTTNVTGGWNASEGFYNLSITARDSSSNSFGNVSVFFAIDTTTPNIILDSPSASYFNSTANPNPTRFVCNATDNFALKNISLYLTDSQNTSGSFSLNLTQTLSNTSGQGDFLPSLANGNYTWNCLVTDSAGNFVFASENRTVLINFTDTGIANFSCEVIHQELEWGEVNCTAGENITQWQFSIVDNSTNESYVVLDTRTQGIRKFVGLISLRSYRVETNATDSLGNKDTITTYLTTRVEGEYAEYYVYVAILALFFVLLGMGYFLEDTSFTILAGFSSVLIGLNLFLNGFPNLTNEFFINGLVMIFAGAGFYLILAPTIDKISEWRGK